MKKQAKKALKHDIEIFGKTVPTLLVALVLMGGLGSAALLQSYGTVSGTATVDQALTIDNTAATGQSGPTIDANYPSSAVVAGSTISTEHSVQNTAAQAVDVTLDTTVDGTPQDSVTGVSANYIVYSQLEETKETTSDSNSVAVNRVAPLTTGNYAVHFTSDGKTTQDYATVWYGVDGLKDSSKLVFDVSSSATPTQADEVYLITKSGQKYAVAATDADSVDGQVTVDFSSDGLYSGTSYSSIANDVVAVGIGYGDASAPFESGGGTKVDVTVDNVRTTDGTNTVQLSESGDTSMSFLETGSFSGTMDAFESGYKYSYDYGYKVQQATSFDVALVPKDYTVETSFTPK